MSDRKRTLPRRDYCADCGQVVVMHHGHWAIRLHSNIRPEAWGYTCRAEIEREPKVKLIRADYHYVAGEIQRHFAPGQGVWEGSISSGGGGPATDTS